MILEVVFFMEYYGVMIVIKIFWIFDMVGLIRMFRRLVEKCGLWGFKFLVFILIVFYKVMYMKYSIIV